MSSRKEWLVAKISEEYCCLNGYLRLCRARGEAVKDMAANIGMSQDTLWYHYRKMDSTAGGAQCMKFSDCMNTVITEIENEKKPGG